MKVRKQVGILLIGDVQGPSLLGRCMMSKFTLPWQTIFSTVSTTAEDVVRQYSKLFDISSVGNLKEVQVSLRVTNENPVFTIHEYYHLQFVLSMKKQVREDFIEKVKHSEWASPTASIV